jgi:hypothetical protein
MSSVLRLILNPFLTNVQLHPYGFHYTLVVPSLCLRCVSYQLNGAVNGVRETAGFPTRRFARERGQSLLSTLLSNWKHSSGSPFLAGQLSIARKRAQLCGIMENRLTLIASRAQMIDRIFKFYV